VSLLTRRTSLEATAALVAAVAYVLVHLTGIPIDPDGWAAWQGAVSIATGQGFTYFSGNPVTAWPPLYSTYLAAWTWLLGPTGWSLLAGNGVLMVVQAVLWMRLALALTAAPAGDNPPALPAFVLAAFLGIFIPLHQRDVFCQNLVYLLLPAYLEAVWRQVRRPDSDFASEFASGFGALHLGLIGVLGGLLWLTHNTAVVFIAAAAFVVWLRRPLSVRSIVGAGLIVVLPVLMWFLLRLALGQGQSHRIGFGAGTYGPVEYLGQLIVGIGRMFAPDRAGLPWLTAIVLIGLVVLVARRPNATGLRFGALTTLIAMACLVLIFSMVAVTSPLTTLRQILFIGLILLPVCALTAAAARPRIVIAVLLVLALPQLYWAALYATGRQFESRPQAHGGHVTEWLVPTRAYVSRDYRSGLPTETPKGLLIAPIAFEEGRR